MAVRLESGSVLIDTGSVAMHDDCCCDGCPDDPLGSCKCYESGLQNKPDYRIQITLVDEPPDTNLSCANCDTNINVDVTLSCGDPDYLLSLLGCGATISGTTYTLDSADESGNRSFIRYSSDSVHVTIYLMVTQTFPVTTPLNRRLRTITWTHYFDDATCDTTTYTRGSCDLTSVASDPSESETTTGTSPPSADLICDTSSITISATRV